eukprot:UN22136
MLVFADEGVSYINKKQRERIDDPHQRHLFAHCKVRPDRFMYANSAGFLVAVVVQSDSTKVVKLT